MDQEYGAPCGTDFNPRSPWGERRFSTISSKSLSSYFNPRSPWGERPGIRGTTISPKSNFNPRSPWGERLAVEPQLGARDNFNPRSPWGERLMGSRFSSSDTRFQSTLPVGGATRYKLADGKPVEHFNPRSPWGERLDSLFQQATNYFISIHAPRGGSDTRSCWCNLAVRISIHAPRGGSDCNTCGC